ncbi:FxSxx-COOH system tetratricopeptide repeat protein [Dactylosporangium sp. CA-092794]|uniref:FxSxx-COOH system tetratricopeptide repeat protein n=1 Tax=Dactylosporangium sp. CA-092794 TaxID=3239929 RepID=UPI003D8D4E0E
MSEPARVTTQASRDALARLLEGIPAGRLAAVAQDTFTFLPLPARFPWHDGGAVVDEIDMLPQHEPGISPLLLYAARLAYEVDDLRSIEINRWIDATGHAGGLSDARLRRLFVSSQPTRIEHSQEHAKSSAEHGATPTSGRYDPKTSNPDISASQKDVIVSGQGVADLVRETLERSEAPRIWGGIPLRNPNFTGRETLLLTLQRSLETRSKASVLPHALHGLGGVGKTQLAVEYAYQFQDRYDLVWWIPAEQQSLVLQSLVDLGRVLGVPNTEDSVQASSLVLDALNSTGRRWLLIYDNATEPDDLAHLIPSSGGHVILTSRNQTWSNVWDAIEVNVFERAESIALLRKRSDAISLDDADRLARTLGDLPLALDQAASWQAATGMSAAEYLDLFEQHHRELLSEGKPVGYPSTIAALVALAYRGLQQTAPAVAQLLELFAVFGAEPITVDLLRRGKRADIPAPLGPALNNPIPLGRMVRDLRKYGLAKVDGEQRIQVHRLFQLVLRDELGEDQVTRVRHTVHRLLAEANPGYPDEQEHRRLHAEIGPHVEPSGLVNAASELARRVVLDQIRYLWVVGDHEGSRRLGEAAVSAWSRMTGHADVGPDGELTLLVTRHLANALLSLGINERARTLAEQTLAKLRANRQFGPDHEHSLATAITVGACQRVAGEFQQALELDTDTIERYGRVYGDGDPETLKNQGNLAVNLRMLSRFSEAFDLDSEIVRTLEESVPEQHPQLLFAQANLARDLYGLGRYPEALDLQERILPTYRQVMPNPKHPNILWASRTLAISLRKNGRYDDAVKIARENYRDCAARYGQDHQHSLAATMTYANTLRVVGDLGEARGLAVDAVERYRAIFGDKHPLSLTAAINLAILRRAMNDVEGARQLDESTHSVMVGTLGLEHGYTLCAANNLANDLALAGDAAGARRLSAETLDISRRSRGPQHPYTLLCAVNAAFDLLAKGDTDSGRNELASAVDALSGVLGPGHPETLDARRGKRAECDIEPPPT